MTAKKFFVATLVAFLVSNVLTTVYYMVTDEPNFVPYRREEMNYLALMVNHLVYAGLMVYFFPYYFRVHATTVAAFWYGVLMAAMMFVPQALVIRGIWEVDINGIFFLNTLAHLLIGGIMGLLIARLAGQSVSS